METQKILVPYNFTEIDQRIGFRGADLRQPERHRHYPIAHLRAAAEYRDRIHDGHGKTLLQHALPGRRTERKGKGFG